MILRFLRGIKSNTRKLRSTMSQDVIMSHDPLGARMG